MGFLSKSLRELRKRRATIPNVPRSLDPEQRRFFSAIKDALDVSAGDRGDGLDANPTWRDLTEIGTAVFSGGRISGAPIPDPTIPNLPDYGNTSIPPAPSNVNVTGTVTSIYITWDTPTEDWIEYAEINHIEVNIGDPSPAVETSAFLGRATPIGIFQHSVEPATRHFYWVRFVSYAGLTGPWHAIGGSEYTTSNAPEAILQEVSDRLNAGTLALTLQSNITSAQTAANTAQTAADTAQTAADNASAEASAAFSQATTADTNATSALTLATSANDKADSALSLVSTAQSTADTASTDAAAALTLATTADGKADSALSLVSTAQSTADTASSDATAALTLATTADGNATSALSLVATAQSTADTASTDATAALALATTADGNANFALTASSNLSSNLNEQDIIFYDPTYFSVAYNGFIDFANPAILAGLYPSGSGVNTYNAIKTVSDPDAPYNTLVWEASEPVSAVGGDKVGYSVNDQTFDGTSRTAVIVGVRKIAGSDTHAHPVLRLEGALKNAADGAAISFYYVNYNAPISSEWRYIVAFIAPWTESNSATARSGVYDGVDNYSQTVTHARFVSSNAAESIKIAAYLAVDTSRSDPDLVVEFTPPKVITGLANYGLPDLGPIFSSPPDTKLVRVDTVESSVVEVAGRVTDIEAEYTVKLDVNGYVSGFGVTNDGATSQALFNVDTFGIGKLGAGNLSFVVDGNQVVMDAAYIKDATITDAKVVSLTVDKITGMDATFLRGRFGTITTSDISGLNASFVTANINNLGVTTAKIADAAITSAKIGSAAVGTLKIAGNAVTVTHAVTFTQSNTYGSGQTLIGSFTYNHGHSTTVPVYIQAQMFVAGASGSGKLLRIRVDSTYYDIFPGTTPMQEGTILHNVLVNLTSGNHTIYMYIDNSAALNSIFSPTMFVLGVKR